MKKRFYYTLIVAFTLLAFILPAVSRGQGIDIQLQGCASQPNICSSNEKCVNDICVRNNPTNPPTATNPPTTTNPPTPYNPNQTFTPTGLVCSPTVACPSGQSCLGNRCYTNGTPVTPASWVGRPCLSNGDCNQGVGGVCVGSNQFTGKQGTCQKADSAMAQAAKSACGITNISACVKEGIGTILSVVVQLLAWILAVTAQLFNLAVKLSILDFHDLVTGSGAINLIWSIGRDLANIFFIFVLMYIAIATVIQKSGTNTQHLVVELIITALLINFSIIIPRVVIDVGNSLANVFYQNMGQPGAFGAPDITGTLVRGNVMNPAMLYTADIEQVTGIPGIATAGGVGKLDLSVIAIRAVGTAVLIIILSYALLVATYLFLARTVVLIFLIATSSLAFFSRIIPRELGGLRRWDAWWSRLITETFFAPFFLFLFYLVLMLANQAIPGGGQASGGWIMGILWYVVICGAAITSIIIARSMSKWSGLVAKQVKDKVANYGGGWVARNTAGRLASKVGESKQMAGFAARAPLIGGAIRGGFKNIAGAKMGNKQSFTGQQEASAKAAKAEMEGMSDEQKARYVQNVTKPKATNLWQGGQFWVGGKEVNKIQAEQLKEMKEPVEQLDQLLSVGKEQTDIKESQKLQGKVMKEAGPSAVARMLIQAERFKKDNDPRGQKAIDSIDTYRGTMVIEDRQKLDEMIKKERRREEGRKNKDNADKLKIELINPATTIKRKEVLIETEAKGIIQAMNPGAAADFLEENPDFYTGAPEILKHFTPAQIGAVIRNNNVSDTVRKDLETEINKELAEITEKIARTGTGGLIGPNGQPVASGTQTEREALQKEREVALQKKYKLGVIPKDRPDD